VRRLLIKDDPVAQDVDEKGAAALKVLVHVPERVRHKAHGRGVGHDAQEPLLRVEPVALVGERLVVDDHEQVEVALVAVGFALGLVDPIAAGVAAEQDDL
jgi:hypothetical protein